MLWMEDLKHKIIFLVYEIMHGLAPRSSLSGFIKFTSTANGATMGWRGLIISCIFIFALQCNVFLFDAHVYLLFIYMFFLFFFLKHVSSRFTH